MSANQFSAGVQRQASSSTRPSVDDRRHGADRAWDDPPSRDKKSHENASMAPPFVIGLVMAIVMFTVGVAQAVAQTIPEAASPTMTTQEAPLARPQLVQLSSVKGPGLLLKSEQPGLYVTAPALATDVKVDITAAIARTVVTQRFMNPSTGWVEGIYAYPLPDGGAVDTLKMIIGDRVIEGVIKERVEAREIYEQAKAEGRKAALMEQERPNLFTNSVANIGPGESVVIQIEYQEPVLRRDHISSLRIPLVVAPRYSPPGDIHLVGLGQSAEPVLVETTGVPDADAITPPVRHPSLGKHNPVTLTVKLDAGFPLGDVTSAHHKITMTRSGNETVMLTLGDGEVPADRDFELTWAAQAGAEPTASLFHERVNGRDYLMAIVAPPAIGSGAGTTPRQPREVIFVIDNSGSMSGASMKQAKQSLDLALSRLEPADRFNVIRFDDTIETVFQWPVDATPGNVARAQSFVRALNADGGTEMLPALRAALTDADPDDRSRLRQVIFLTDGAIGNEGQMFREIKANKGRSRIFTVGIGSAPNSFFMTRAAMVGRGSFTHIGSEDQVSERMAALFRMLELPVMTGLEAAWSDGIDTETWPNPIPDLYAGEPVSVIAQADGMEGTLTLTGMAAGQPWRKVIDLATAVQGKGVARLWARRKITELEGRRYGSANVALFDKSILKVALTHSLVTRLTSLVAIDKSPERPAGERLTRSDVPLDLPAGWNFEKIFGPAPDTREALRATPDLIKAQYAQLLKVSRTNPASAAAKQTPKGVVLPEGATLADRQIMLGLLVILFALSLTTVMVFFRHLAGSVGQEGHPA